MLIHTVGVPLMHAHNAQQSRGRVCVPNLMEILIITRYVQFLNSQLVNLKTARTVLEALSGRLPYPQYGPRRMLICKLSIVRGLFNAAALPTVT